MTNRNGRKEERGKSERARKIKKNIGRVTKNKTVPGVGTGVGAGVGCGVGTGVGSEIQYDTLVTLKIQKNKKSKRKIARDNTTTSQ